MHKDSVLHIEVPLWDNLNSESTDPLMSEHIHQFTTSSLSLLLKHSKLAAKNMERRINPLFSTTPNWRIVANASIIEPTEGTSAYAYLNRSLRSREDA